MRRRAQPWLGTLVEISTPIPEEAGRQTSLGQSADDKFDAACNAAFAAVARVHQRMSFHDRASDVAAINRLEPGQSILVDPHTATVLRCALKIEQASNGCFNIACGAALASLGYLPIPNDALIPPEGMPPRAAVSIDDANWVTKIHSAWIDLGGIAKGYAVDLALDTLQAAGIGTACVNAGGDLRVCGPVDFQIAIRDPQAPTHAGLRLALRDQALATSGSYFSSREIDGIPHSELLNGRTGKSLSMQHSVSILAPVCMLADALTKVVIVSGDTHHPLLRRFAAAAVLV